MECTVSWWVKCNKNEHVQIQSKQLVIYSVWRRYSGTVYYKFHSILITWPSLYTCCGWIADLRWVQRLVIAMLFLCVYLLVVSKMIMPVLINNVIMMFCPRQQCPLTVVWNVLIGKKDIGDFAGAGGWFWAGTDLALLRRISSCNRKTQDPRLVHNIAGKRDYLSATEMNVRFAWSSLKTMGKFTKVNVVKKVMSWN